MALTGKAISQFSAVTSISTGTLFPVVDPTYPLATRNKTIALSDLVVSMPSIPNVVYQTGNQTISGYKTFSSSGNFQNSLFIGTGVDEGESTTGYMLYVKALSGQNVVDFDTYNGEGLAIDVSGRVGIGTDSPTSTLHVTGNIQIGRYLTNRADSQTPAGTNMVGVNAGNTGATNSNFFGPGAGFTATGASNSNFIGNSAGSFGYTASNSNFIGNAAGSNANNASYSNFIGYQAGSSAVNGKNSIFIGYNAGYLDSVNNTTNGGSSILIGDYTNAIYSNSISIGRGTANSTSGQLNLGNVIFANGIGTGTSSSSVAITTAKVGIGTNTPAYTLDVNGSGSFKSGLSISGAFILTPIINSGSFTIGSNPFYIYTGASAGTGTMPSIGSSIGRAYFLKNRGAGTFTISGNSTDQFYYTGATTGSIPMANGQGFTVINDGTYWDVISKLI